MSGPDSMAASGPALRLLGRPGCHLCDDMIAVLHPYLDAGRLTLTLIDVDSDPVLTARYGLLIPVLLEGDREIAHYTLTPDVLDAYLHQAVQI